MNEYDYNFSLQELISMPGRISSLSRLGVAHNMGYTNPSSHPTKDNGATYQSHKMAKCKPAWINGSQFLLFCGVLFMDSWSL